MILVNLVIEEKGSKLGMASVAVELDSTVHSERTFANKIMDALKGAFDGETVYRNEEKTISRNCPFCGSANCFLHEEDNSPEYENADSIQPDVFYVSCSDCDAFGPSRFTKNEAFDAWRKRA